jgi:predicted nucleic acid-binding protein
LEKQFELAWSYMLDYENYFNPYDDRRNAISAWRRVAMFDIDASDAVFELGKQIMCSGVKQKDALHIACAITAKCDYFLTTDKRILSAGITKVIPVNPLDFVKQLEV